MKKNVSFEKEIEFPSMIGEITSISLDHSLEFQSKSRIEGEFVVSGTYKMTEASTLEEKFSYPIPVEIELLEVLEEDTRKVSISNFNYAIVNDDILKCDIEVLVEGVEEITVEEVEEEKIEVLEENEKKEEKELFEISEEKEREEKEVEEKKEEIPNQEDNDFRECDGDIKEEEEKIIEEKVEKEEKIIEEKVVPERVEEEIVEVEEDNKVVEEPIEINNVVTKEEKEEVSKEEVSMEEKQESNNMSSLFQAFETSEETFTTYSVYIVRKEDSIEKIMDTYKISRESLSEYNDLSEIEIGSKIIIPTCNE